MEPDRDELEGTGVGLMRCIESRRGTCKGDVEPRESLSGTGTPIARCDHHYDLRLDEQERIERTYGTNSDVAPAWIDPTYAGEKW